MRQVSALSNMLLIAILFVLYHASHASMIPDLSLILLSASDTVLRLCIESKSSFVVCPCCYGSMMQSRPPGQEVVDHKKRFGDLHYPQSNQFASRGWKMEMFSALCKKADRKFWAHDSRSEEHNEEVSDECISLRFYLGIICCINLYMCLYLFIRAWKILDGSTKYAKLSGMFSSL